jgi:aspartate/methionine/tyrosine aminotransferase
MDLATVLKVFGSVIILIMENFVAYRAKRISYSEIREIVEIADRMEGVIRLEQGEPDFDTPSHIKDAAIRAIKLGFTKYSPIAGLPELRKAIADKLHRENDIYVNPESEVIVTSGSTEAMFTSILTVVNPGDEVLIPDPGYVSYERFVKLAEGIPIFYEIGYEPPRIDLEGLKEKITARTKAIIINTPGNPLGNVLTKEELKALSELCIDHNIVAISDEIYEKIVFDGRKNLSIGSFPDMEERTITINGFSKTYAFTGWRIGYIAAKGELAEQINKVHSNVVLCANTIAQYAALTALLYAQDCVKSMVEEYEKRRDMAVKKLNEVDNVHCSLPEGAFYLFPEISRIERDSKTFVFKLLKEKKVAVIPGVAFGKHGEGHFRISLTRPKDELVEGIRKIIEFIKNYTEH